MKAKCDYCGASFLYERTSKYIKCEYCGNSVIVNQSIPLISEAKKITNRLKPASLLSFNLPFFSALLSKINKLKIIKLIIFIAPITILAFLLIPKKDKNEWIKIDVGNTDKIKEIYLKLGKWKENKRFRFVSERFILPSGMESTLEYKYDCDRWRYKRIDGEWSDITYFSNGHNWAAEHICKKPKPGRWKLVPFNDKDGIKRYVRKMFSLEGGRIKVVEVKHVKPFTDKDDIKPYKLAIDCMLWGLNTGKRGWRPGIVKTERPAYKTTTLVCGHKPFENKKFNITKRPQKEWTFAREDSDDKGEVYYRILAKSSDGRYVHYMQRYDGKDGEEKFRMSFIGDCKIPRFMWLEGTKWFEELPETSLGANQLKKACRNTY